MPVVMGVARGVAAELDMVPVAVVAAEAVEAAALLTPVVADMPAGMGPVAALAAVPVLAEGTEEEEVVVVVGGLPPAVNMAVGTVKAAEAAAVRGTVVMLLEN
ncbi:hypothetical protein QJS10_CPA10g01166 [Acorus calamus]|uniref:Uncharacterized protein n=1 Tax=Acorus calamus TaxID=4465 RepID=A0AAV9E060_ACOCL|nr:hypothetical protein QJS10_CPA10g01166 [Acorus calamus]